MSRFSNCRDTDLVSTVRGCKCKCRGKGCCHEQRVTGPNILSDPSVEAQVPNGPGGNEIPITETTTHLPTTGVMLWSDSSVAPFSRFAGEYYPTVGRAVLSSANPRTGGQHLRVTTTTSLGFGLFNAILISEFRKCLPLGTEWQNYFVAIIEPGDFIRASFWAMVNTVSLERQVGLGSGVRLYDSNAFEAFESLPTSGFSGPLLATSYTQYEWSGIIPDPALDPWVSDYKYADFELHSHSQPGPGGPGTLIIDIDDFELEIA